MLAGGRGSPLRKSRLVPLRLLLPSPVAAGLPGQPLAKLLASGTSVRRPGAVAALGQPGFFHPFADLLRGDYKQSEYGKVILPFTILRRLDCVLEATK